MASQNVINDAWLINYKLSVTYNANLNQWVKDRLVCSWCNIDGFPLF